MAKNTTRSARKRSDNVVAMPAIESRPLLMSDQSVDVADSDIARRAFELYCLRGCQHGYDLGDWLQAEHELRHGDRSAVA